MKTIALTKGYKTVVDDKDFSRLAQKKWYAQEHAGRVYARATTHPLNFLHWEVVGKPPKGHTDHINGDSLDNRRANLRHVSVSDNISNQRKAQKDLSLSFLMSTLIGAETIGAHKSASMA